MYTQSTGIEEKLLSSFDDSLNENYMCNAACTFTKSMRSYERILPVCTCFSLKIYDFITANIAERHSNYIETDKNHNLRVRQYVSVVRKIISTRKIINDIFMVK